jgi:protein phosphatase
VSIRELVVPDLALVVLVGVSGSGKSTFARRHFLPTQVISSDFCRGLVADDENDQAATPDAFELLHAIAAVRLRRGRLTVVDATNVKREDRAALVRLARDHDVLPVAIVLDVPERVCVERNAARPDRDLAPGVIPRQRADLRRGIRGLAREGFRKVHVLHDVAEVDSAAVTYEKQYNDRRELTGPFDVVGDVHGCRAELEELLGRLGYPLIRDGDTPRAGRRSSWATWWTAAPTPRASCAWSWAWSPRARRCACPATTRTSWCARCAAGTCRSATASSARWRSSARSRRSSGPRSNGSATA